MAAAVRAAQDGHAVTVFEAARSLGGRARALAATLPDGTPVTLDNGQHILIGAYTETLRLMRTVGMDPDAALLRLPLALGFPDGTGLALPKLPTPLDALVGILAARGWHWRDKLALLRTAHRWQRGGFACAAHTTVADLCAPLTPRLRNEFIEPLCVSALNTPAVRASGQVFLRVLQDALFGQRGGSNLLLPRTDLGALFPEPAARWLARHGGAIHTGCRIRHVLREPAGWRLVGDTWPAGTSTVYDRVILAISASNSALALVESSKFATELEAKACSTGPLQRRRWGSRPSPPCTPGSPAPGFAAPCWPCAPRPPPRTVRVRSRPARWPCRAAGLCGECEPGRARGAANRRAGPRRGAAGPGGPAASADRGGKARHLRLHARAAATAPRHRPGPERLLATTAKAPTPPRSKARCAAAGVPRGCRDRPSACAAQRRRANPGMAGDSRLVHNVRNSPSGPSKQIRDYFSKTSSPPMHDIVQDYYGRQLQSTADLKTSACCDIGAVPAWLKPLLARIHPEVLSRYYGCGLVSRRCSKAAACSTWAAGRGATCTRWRNWWGPRARWSAWT